MKRKNVWVAIALTMMAAVVAGCSKDDSGTDDGSTEPQPEPVVSPEIPDNTEPEFNGISLMNPKNATQTTSYINGAEIRKDGYGHIKWLFFQDCPNPPATAVEMFQQYMELDTDDSFELYSQERKSKEESSPLTLECYFQRYKGVLVSAAGYAVRFNEGKVTDCNGSYLEIKDLDVKPAISTLKAREIYAKYLGVSVDLITEHGTGPWADDCLMIMDLPKDRNSTVWAPRLVYSFYYKVTSDKGIGYIDAQTGRMLMTSPNYID